MKPALFIIAVLLVSSFVIILHHSSRQEMRIKKQEEKHNELQRQYRTLYKNVELEDGYCAARRATRQQSERDAQFYEIKRTNVEETPKSIEVL